MNSETADTMNTMTGSTTGTTGSSTSGMNTGMNSGMNSGMSSGNVQRVAQKAHEAVDKLEQTLSSSTDKMMGWQEEYGEMAREQIRANPLAVVLGAFAVGYLFAKITR